GSCRIGRQTSRSAKPTGPSDRIGIEGKEESRHTPRNIKVWASRIGRSETMPEPVSTLSLAALGATALTEGVKFLYAQAGELLKRWRERRDKASGSDVTESKETEAVAVTLPSDVFEGDLVDPVIHFSVLKRAEEQFRGLRRDLADYAEGIEPVGP